MAKATPKQEETSEDTRPDYNPSEVTITEMMHMKNVDRDEALRILRNPTPPIDLEEERSKAVKAKK